MKQEYTGPYTFDVAARTITLAGIEVPQGRLALVVNSTVGFIYHNIEHEPTAQVSIVPSTVGGILSAVGYDAIDSFNGDYALFQGGLDKGGVVNIVGGVITVVNPGNGYSAGFANSVGGTRFVIDIDPSFNTVIVFPRYKDCENHQNTDALSIFYDDGVDLGQLIKDESDETQALLQAEFDEMQTLVSAFKEEFKDEIDHTQSVLETRLESIDITLADFQAEALAESNATQNFLSDTLRPVLDDFKTEAKSEADATQTLLNLKLAGLINGFLGVEHLVKYSSENGYDIEIVPATYDGVNRNTGYSPSQIVFSKGGGVSMTIFLHYDNEGHLILVTSQYWTPSLLDTRAIWLDASDLTSIVTSGQYVTRWNSQLDSTWSARPFDNPPTADSRPKSGVATINDLNAISFDAVDDDLLTYKNGIRRALADVDQGAQYSKEAVFIVARRNAPSSSRWLSAGVSGNRNFGTFFPGLGVNRMILDIGPNRVDYYYPAAFPAVGLFSFFVDSTAPSSELFFNGTRVSLDTTPFDMFAGRQDGVGGTTIGPGSGDDFGEVLVLREVPDRTTRQKIEGYLAHKWGLTGGLPADHPHKFAPPGV